MLKIDLKPFEVSKLVDSYGIDSSHIIKVGDDISFRIPPIDTDDYYSFKSDLESGSWYLDENSGISIDYKKLVQSHQGFCAEIAQHILNELKNHKCDSYFNRIQAVLNFVQHIPYGQPNFDKENFTYLGLALPPESFVLNYSDCDSKSIFFAAILFNIIQPNNIVLVKCITTGPHMMVAVKGINNSNGRYVQHEGERYLLIETTTPSVIGSWNWAHFELNDIVSLA
jgi:hypothetical protein